MSSRLTKTDDELPAPLVVGSHHHELNLPPADFKLVSDFKPAGDQPAAIAHLIDGLRQKQRNQVLLGVTGSGKTFSMAHVIQQYAKPTLIMAPNKTLAAQLFSEMRGFFPDNAVEYFVSYYDYYQPEAYVPRSDTYIEKEATINEQIDRLRHSATRSLLERRDVIIIASVSCIYGLGSPELYSRMVVPLAAGQTIKQATIIKQLVELQYRRNDMVLERGTFRVRGDVLDIVPAHMDERGWRINMWGDEIDKIDEFDTLTGEIYQSLTSVRIYAGSHYVTPLPTVQQAMKHIKAELQQRIPEFEAAGKLIEAQRIKERTQFDLEMLEATGTCQGIENYSRYLSGRAAGEPPPTLFEYLPADALLIVDESHVTVPQLNGMYKGDRARKTVLSEYGFRLPSCLDNRPLAFHEWEALRPPTIFVSATPGPWELEQTGGVFAEQIVRPTGLIDPPIVVRPTAGQIDDLIGECKRVVANKQRALVTTLTKRMAEALTEYLTEAGLNARYLHADVETLERIELLRDLRMGVFDILVGINLLREGLDIPECALVAILDADKEGFLRGRTSLIQTVGRAARNVDGIAIMYADRITDSMQAAIDETSRRRNKQLAYNKEHGITPESVKKSLPSLLNSVFEKADHGSVEIPTPPPAHDVVDLQKQIDALTAKMHQAALDLEFEKAAELRDDIKRLTTRLIEGDV